uniref:C2H2-type domain-containing protein n=1 Tax=Branchiostoma floridae TaxID=7739 RepID=C3XYP2_BRAFL|eukprot:XP_002610917.1 hypothetical protein BRAFLDRAFT_91514 [Branchiostoma floridae]
MPQSKAGGSDLAIVGLVERTRGEATPRTQEHDITRPEPLFVSVSPINNPLEQGRVTVHTCGQCGEQFREQEALHHHVQLLHQAPCSSHNDPYGDVGASPGMTGRQSLDQSHMLSFATPDGTLSYPCSDCDMTFMSSTDLLAHIEAAHQKAHCTLCGQNFSCNSSLQRHIRAVHSALRHYVCDVCGKAFKRKDHLQRHMQNTCRT